MWAQKVSTSRRGDLQHIVQGAPRHVGGAVDRADQRDVLAFGGDASDACTDGAQAEE